MLLSVMVMKVISNEEFMKKLLKSIVKITVFTIIFTLTGCAEENADADIISSPELIKLSWQDQRMDLERQYKMVAVTDDTIYGCYEELGDIIITFQDKMSGDIIKQVNLPEITNIQSIDADYEGNVFGTGILEERSVFWKIDNEGNPSVLDGFLLENTENAQHITPKGVYVDSKGYFYTWYEMGVPASEFYDDEEADVYSMVDRIYIKDAQLNTIFYVQVANSRGSELLSFVLDENDKPTIIAKDMDGIYIQTIDMEKMDFSAKTHVENINLTEMTENIFLTETGILFCLGSTLYEYDYDNQETGIILNLSSYGILPSNILYLGMKNNVIEVIDNYSDNSNSEYIALIEGVSEKIILTLGTLQVSTDLEKIVADFNRFSKSSRVEIMSYNNNNDYDKALAQLKLDIIRGAASDIIDVSRIDYGVFYDKEILVDLYTYMQNDEECNANMLMSSVVEAYEIKGHLFSICPAFQIYSMWGKNSIINNRSGITLAELKKMLEDGGKSLNAIYGFSADEKVLTTLCTFGMDEFVDWDNGTCNFTGEYFEEILTFANEYDGGYTDEGILREIEKGDIVMSVGMISSIADYQIQSKLYQNDLTFVGYPVGSGSGTAISYRGSELAVNAQGANKDAAWEFVKYYLLNGYVDQGFPTIKTQFDEVTEAAKESIIVTSEEDTYEAARGTCFDGNIYIQVFSVEQDDIDAVRRLIDIADNKFEYNTNILNIIDEEAQSYFTGQKDLKNVAELIQNRVQLYLSENKE